jgi:hypothetical protein
MSCAKLRRSWDVSRSKGSKIKFGFQIRDLAKLDIAFVMPPVLKESRSLRLAVCAAMFDLVSQCDQKF